MDLSITLSEPFFGLSLAVEIDGRYEHECFEPEAVYLDSLADNSADDTDTAGAITQRIELFLPTAADVSDFYSAHGEAIDAAVSAELADPADPLDDSDTAYDMARQEALDDARA